MHGVVLETGPNTCGDRPTGPLEVRASGVAQAAARRASSHDIDGAFPRDDIRDLHAAGLLDAPFPRDLGGEGLGIGDPDRTLRVLSSIGGGSLSLGRLYEGHVNAIGLAVRYGSTENLRLLKAEARAGRISGVWMAGQPLRLVGTSDTSAILHGAKIFCSGAGFIQRPLVAADVGDASVMLIPRIDDAERVDAAGWTAHGMRATATGTVDLDGIEVLDAERVGTPGDYLRSPYFRGGAWRVLAVQLGGLEAILDLYGAQLRTSPHRDHPIQLARYGEAVIACETARLWVEKAARVAEGPVDDPAAIDAYVDLARNAFERAALQAVGLAQKALGLAALLRPNPLERVVRDLTTYLRQPGYDASLLFAAAFRLAQPRERA